MMKLFSSPLPAASPKLSVILFVWITACCINKYVLGGDVTFLKSQSDLRSITLEWIPDGSGNISSDHNVHFLVKYCEDNPWDDTPRSCKSLVTNQTLVQIKDLRPSTKYLLTVEQSVGRAGRMLLPDSTVLNGLPANSHGKPNEVRINRDKAVSVETQKYAIGNVDCLRGQTTVSVETGEEFEGLITVQRPDGSPDMNCLTRGDGSYQRVYALIINHTRCSVDFRENKTLMNAIVLIQEHPSLVLGSDRSFRISCNYQPAVIQLQTGVSGGTEVVKSSRMSTIEHPEPPATTTVRTTSSVLAKRKMGPTRAVMTPQPSTKPFLLSPFIIETKKLHSNRQDDRTVPHAEHIDNTDVLDSSYEILAPQGIHVQHVIPVLGKNIPSIHFESPSDVLSSDLYSLTPLNSNLSLNNRHDSDAANVSWPWRLGTGNEMTAGESERLTLVQIIAIAATGSFLAIMLITLLLWLLIFRQVCAHSKRRSVKIRNYNSDDERYG